MPFCKRNLIIYFAALCFLSAAGNVYSQDPADNNGRRSVNLRYFIEGRDSAGPEQVYAIFREGKFTALEKSIFNLGIAPRPVWIQFEASNFENKNTKITVEIQNSRLNVLELFEVNGLKLSSLGKMGDFYPFAERFIPYRNFVYEINYRANETKNFLLYVNQTGHTLECSVNIYANNDFRSDGLGNYLRSGFTYGILFVVAVMSFVFFGSTRQYLYLYYSLYIITAIAWFLAYFGIGYQYIWGQYPGVNTFMAPVMASLNLFLNIQICQILLKLSGSHRKMYVVAVIVKSLLLLVACIPLLADLNSRSPAFNRDYMVLFLVTVLISMIFLIAIVVRFAFIGLLAAKFYFWASILKAGSIIYLALLELGFSEGHVHIEESMQAGIFLEILLLTCALAKQYTNFRVNTFMQVIKAHENERLALSQELHDGLANSLAVISLGLRHMIDFGDYSPGAKRELEGTYTDIRQAHLEARSAFYDTKPEDIQDKTLSELGTEYINRITARLEKPGSKTRYPKINFSYNEPSATLPEIIKQNTFRIIQELVTNIIKHSKATTADILISFDKKAMTLTAEDDGIGFDLRNTEGRNGHGIANVESRTKMLNGRFVIRSTPKKENLFTASNGQSQHHGTLIQITIPLGKNIFNKKYNNEY